MTHISTLKKRPASIVLAEQNKKHCSHTNENSNIPSVEHKVNELSDDPFLDNDDEIYANLDLDYDETRIACLTNSFQSSHPLYEEDFELDACLLQQLEEQENLLQNQLNSISTIAPHYEDVRVDSRNEWAQKLQELENQKEAV